MRIEFTVWGVPVGKGRPRFSKIGSYVKTYTPEKTANYETLVKFAYSGKQKFHDEAQLGMVIKAFFPIPKSASKKKKAEMILGKLRPAKKPDGDNIIKAICDALNEIAYHDDSQIVEITIEKYYAEEPRAEITIYEV